MTPDQWRGIQFFKSTDNWGEPERVSFNLVKELDLFRAFVATPINVNVGTQGTHVEHSEHYLGLAVDICFPQKGVKDLFELFIAACRFKFTGIGLYSNWKFNGKVIGGMHLDMRLDPVRKLWIGAGAGESQHYIALSQENLKKNGFLA